MNNGFYVGQHVKAACTYGKEKIDKMTARRGVIAYIHSQGRHITVDFGPYKETVFPDQIELIERV